MPSSNYYLRIAAFQKQVMKDPWGKTWQTPTPSERGWIMRQHSNTSEVSLLFYLCATIRWVSNLLNIIWNCSLYYSTMCINVYESIENRPFVRMRLQMQRELLPDLQFHGFLKIFLSRFSYLIYTTPLLYKSIILQELQIFVCEFEVQIWCIHNLCLGGATRNRIKNGDNDIEFASSFCGRHHIQHTRNGT